MRTQDSDDYWASVPPAVVSSIIADTVDSKSSFVHPMPPSNQLEEDVLRLSVTPKHEFIGTKSATTFSSACVSIEACEMPEERTSSVDICVALDVSSSMRESKLRDCKSTLQAMLRPLTAKDRLGLITFGIRCDVVFPALLMTNENKAAAIRKIQALILTVNGCTNLSGGLSLAWKELLLVDNPNPVRSLFLLTDGNANGEIKSTPELVEMVNSFNTGSPTDIAAALNRAQSNPLEDQPRPFLPFVQLLLKYLEHKDPKMHRQAKDIIKDCCANKCYGNKKKKKKKKELGCYQSVSMSMQPRLKHLVGESHWRIAMAHLERMSAYHQRQNKGVHVQWSPPSTIPRAVTLTNKGAPVSLFCFGYGSDRNSEMLQAISEAGNGGYYFVENDSDVFTAFGDAMGGILSIMAQTAVLKISVPPAAVEAGVKIREVHHDSKEVDQGDGSITVNLGDFYAEERRDVLIDFDLVNVTSNCPALHLISKLSFLNVLTKKNTVVGPSECSISRPDSADLSVVNQDVAAQWLRVRVAREMEQADREARSNNTGRAKGRLAQMQATIQASPAYVVTDNKFYSSLNKMVEMAMEDLEEAERTKSYYKGHRTKNATQVLKSQRACSSNPSFPADLYQTSVKKKMVSAFHQEPSWV